ncbi:hypothetical protein HHI36_006364 [Cryptolaemus montrouzieri]|uniref:Multidrug resistance-associated protein lethal(2)03659 n=1 Tax=Cryptolaemus montrouzieri TaxID=559131 RepID=A0ABD2NX35_9CUCU
MEEKTTDSKKPNPRESASFISKLFFIWTIPLFVEGNRKDLIEDDLYKPLKSHSSHLLGNKLEDAWLRQTKSKHKSIFRALWSVFKIEICGYVLLNFLFVFGAKLCQPILLMQILNYYIPGQTSISETQAKIYVVAIILLTLLGSISGHTYVMGMLQLGMKLRISICSLMYRKTLRLSKFAMNSTSTGQIINLLSNDVRMFDYVMLDTCLLVIAPTELIVDSLLLYFLLGKTALVGVAFLLMFIPLQMYNGKLSANYRFKIAKRTDQRILLMSEIISGIQVIKMYTWEIPFAKLVEAARRLEVKQIRGAAYVNAFMHSYSMYISRTAQFICIMAFVLTGHTPVAQYVFVLTAFYNHLTKTLSVNFPDAISTFAETRVSCKRIEKYLTLEEVQLPAVSIQKTKLAESQHHLEEISEAIIKLNKVRANWNTNETNEDSLFNINLEVKPMDKIAIIGTVGSGKSSLLNIILQELPVTQGQMKINGTISYASQEPWLFKGSIRQNILFGRTMDPIKYKDVIRVCALQKDFEMFPFGDQSIVGEKGVMLSGGQKARINLARSVYQDADIYLLDDPLSAVDTHVGKQLYDQCILGYLSKKCVILVTHQLQYLRTMNQIHIMEKGTIIQSGTYQDLVGKTNVFVRLNSNVSDSDAGETQYSNEGENEKIDEKGNGPTDVQEHISKGAMSRNVYKQYFKAGGKWYIYIPLLMLFIATQLFASTGDYFITFWVNLEQFKAVNENLNSTNSANIIKPTRSFFGQTYDYYQSIFTTELCIYIYSSIICLLIIITLTRSISFFQYCLSASTHLHNNMFVKISRAPMRFFNTNPSGRILNRFSKDIGSIDEILPVLLLDTIEIGITVIAVSIILTSINPWMSIPTVTMLILFYSYKQYFIKTSRSIKRLEGRVRSPIFSHMTASLQGLSTIRAFKAEDNLTEEFDKHQDLHSAAYYLFLSCNRAFGMLLDINCIVYVAIVTVSTFFTATFGGNVGLSITQALSLTGRLQWGVRQWSETENQMTSVERVLEYSNIDPEIDTEKEPQSDWPDKGSIQFRLVSMRYAPDEPAILNKLKFNIEPKEKIGIVGRTGAGKSSVIAAIFRLAAVEGKIIIDGVDTNEISLKSLRSKISIIPQEPFLFSGTLRKNLDPFDEYDDATMWNALKEVELKTVVEDCPSGLNYQISEGGTNFSVGQRQLICLARALIRRNKILIMDEATANVDPKTDELIQNTIKLNFQECTVITIAHRLHTIMDSDKVLVMNAGCAVEFGHPHILLSDAQGLFSSLVMETGKGMSDSLKKVAKDSYDKINSSRATTKG